MNGFFFSLMMLGAVSNGGQMPFWEYSNQFDLMPLTSGYSTILDAGMSTDPARAFQFNCGTTLALRGDAFDKCAFIPSQAYVGLKWKKLSLDLGLKNPTLLYYGADKSLGSLSSTSGNLIMSGNARNMPGVSISLDPVGVPFTNGHLQFTGQYGEYLMMGQRSEGRTLAHNLKLYLLGKVGNFTLGIGLDHWAQWKWTGFADYLRVITGSHGGSGASLSDRVNVIGNQLGAEKLFVKYDADDWSLEFRHDIPYDDKSGMRFDNFPDGMNYFVLSFRDKNRWVSDILYEYDYTIYQSGPIHEAEFDEKGVHIPWTPGRNIFGLDNYFNNGEFRSGWTHCGMTIGTPLFFPVGTRDGSWSRDKVCKGVENNRIRAHHLGVSGKIARLLPYRLMASYSLCYGRYSAPYTGESQIQKKWGTVKETPLRQFSLGFNMEIPIFKGSFVILPGIYFDRGEVLADSVGASLGLKYILR